MKANLTGLLVSLLIHSGLFLLIVYSVAIQPAPEKEDKKVSLHLAMFQEIEPAIKAESKPEVIPKEELIKKPLVKKPPVKKTVKKEIVKQQKNSPKKKPKPKPKVKDTPPQKFVEKPSMATLINQALTASKPPAKTKNAAPPTNKLPVAKQAAKNTQNKAAEQQYKSRLHQVIAQQKKYPARAKRKQEEGTVTVSFVIYANGSIQNLKIVRSSGSDSLDQAAINTVKQISNRLPFPAEINRKQWQLTLPLVYRLR